MWPLLALVRGALTRWADFVDATAHGIGACVLDDEIASVQVVIFGVDEGRGRVFTDVKSMNANLQ